MDQHPIPRQITTFEFKLIGFMTLRQFLYVLAFLPFGYFAYLLTPINYEPLKMGMGALVVAIGMAFAFIKYQDRGPDEWIKVMLRSLNSPTQYVYKKDNPPIRYLNNLFFLNDPHKIKTHIESRDKLGAYIATVRAQQKQVKDNASNATRVKQVQSLLEQKMTGTQTVPSDVMQAQALPPAQIITQLPINATPLKEQFLKMISSPPVSASMQKTVAQQPAPLAQPQEHKPSLIGVVKNTKLIPLPGIMIYVKNDKSVPVRLLKSNPHGVFASYNVLDPGSYTVETKDPRNSYLFDTMNITVSNTNDPIKLDIISKTML